MKLLFLDTETTGNDLKKDRLCQICYHDGKETVVEFFKPPVPIGVKSMSITHITNKMVADKPAFIGSPTFTKLQELLKTHALVAHNAPFDIAMLKAEGLEIPRFICTLRVARALDETDFFDEYNLQFLRYAMDLEVPGNAHDAEGDVNVLRAVFGRMHQKLAKQLGDEEKAYEKMVELSMQPSLFKKFTFGKYKGETLENVAKRDKGYLEWMLKQKLEAPDEDADWIHTLKHYLGKK